MKKNIKEVASMNISVSADDTQSVKDLMSILRNAGLDNAGTYTPTMSISAGTSPEPKMTPCGSKIEDSYDNEPDEEYQDTEYMTKDLAGGINRSKKMYKASQQGDNAMAVENDELDEQMKQGTYDVPATVVFQKTFGTPKIKKTITIEWKSTHYNNDPRKTYMAYWQDQMENHPEVKKMQKDGYSIVKMTAHGDEMKLSDDMDKIKTEESYTDHLENMLRRVLEGKKRATSKDQDGDGDLDFADVQIARMTKSGMSKDKAIKKTKDKPYNETKTVSESKEINDIVKLALYESNHKKEKTQSSDVINLKKLAGI